MALISSIILVVIISIAWYMNVNNNNSNIEQQTENKVNETNMESEYIENQPTPELNGVSMTKPKKDAKKILKNVEDEFVEEETEIVMHFDEDDVIALAKVLYNECRGIPSTTEKACVGWTVCNRVGTEYGDTIYEVITSPYQFAYWYDTPITDELYDLSLDILTRWNKEMNGFENVGRVLPSNYLWFSGDGEHNYFRNKFSGDYDVWDYDFIDSRLRNPYVD